MIFVNTKNSYKIITIIDVLVITLFHCQNSGIFLSPQGLSANFLIPLCSYLFSSKKLKPPINFTEISYMCVCRSPDHVACPNYELMGFQLQKTATQFLESGFLALIL